MCKRPKSATRILASIACLAALGALPPSELRAEETPRLDIITPPDASVDIDAPFSIQVLARGAPVVLEGAVFAVTDDNTTKSLNSAFSLTPGTEIGIKTPTTISFTVDRAALAQTASAKGALFLQYQAANSQKTETGQRWTFLLIRPAPEVTVFSHPINITRYVPFREVPLYADLSDACLAYQTTPALFPLRVGTQVPGEVFAAGNDAPRIQRLTIEGKVASATQICVTTSIPGQYTELKGRLWLRPPNVKKAVDVELDLRVKDAWGWRVAATALATLFALAFIYWTTTVRRRLLNGARRDAVSNRLAEFLAAHPALATHDSVVFVRQLILDSAVADRTGDFDVSAQSLASASSRLDQLTVSPPAAPIAIASSGQAIRIVNPPLRLLTGERIAFVIGAPNSKWPAEGMYQWTVAQKGGTPLPPIQGVSLKRFDYTFRSSGEFTVQVTVDGANQETRDLTILPRPAKGMIAKFKVVEIAVVVMTFLIAAGTAFATTQDAATFGTVGDYIKLLAASFGLSGGAGGAATVFTAIRGR